MFPFEVALVLGGIVALILTIIVYVHIMPRKNDGKFENKFKQTLHDFFHFKKLYLEEILKFVYVLATIASMCVGFMLLLGYVEKYYYSLGTYYDYRESTFLYGLATMIGGPIALRLGYEILMMAILLVKNVIEINSKLPMKNDKSEPEEQVFSTRLAQDGDESKSEAQIKFDSERKGESNKTSYEHCRGGESKSKPNVVNENSWICGRCGKRNLLSRATCWSCDTPLEE